MTYANQRVEKAVAAFKKLLPIFAFIAPFLILYSLYPASFEFTWKGRTYYLFFLWLILLETILSWEEIKTEKWKIKSIKTAPILAAFMLPTIYVVASQCLGLDALIVDLAEKIGVEQNLANFMPLSIEYLVFTTFAALILVLEYGISDLQKYSISVFFLGLIGMIYMIDNLYPYGRFTPFQIIVPTTTTFAANFLNLIGFQTSTSTHTSAYYGSLSRLKVYDTQGKLLARFDIAWPCSGVESLLIYTVTILLFLKKMDISWKHKTLYFMIGAVVTYFINVLRIATIFMIAINQGDWLSFHNFYGQLYSITWIISYPLMVIGSQALWGKIRNWRTEHKQPFTVS